jgi:hypothetical protein
VAEIEASYNLRAFIRAFASPTEKLFLVTVTKLNLFATQRNLATSH